MQITAVFVKFKVTEKEKRKNESSTIDRLFPEVSWFKTLQPNTELTLPLSVYLKDSAKKARAGLFRTYTSYRFKEPHL